MFILFGIISLVSLFSFYTLKYYNYIYILVVIVSVSIVIIWYNAHKHIEYNKFMMYTLLMIAYLLFWSFYSLTPILQILFITYNVNLTIMSITLAPQWLLYMDVIFIIILSPIISTLFKYTGKFNAFSQYSNLFALAFISLSISFILFRISIYYANPKSGLVNAWWVILGVFIEDLAAILMIPTSYTMIKTFIPQHLQSVMMSINTVIIGISGSIAGCLSGFILHNIELTHPKLSNIMFIVCFTYMFYLAVFIGCLILLLQIKFNLAHKNSHTSKTLS